MSYISKSTETWKIPFLIKWMYLPRLSIRPGGIRPVSESACGSISHTNGDSIPESLWKIDYQNMKKEYRQTYK